MDKILNVYKYEPKDNENILITNTNASKSKRTVSKIFDDFDVYTKIKNINNYPNIFNDPEEEIVITEKIHGTNFRAGNLKYKVRYKIFGKLIDSILSILKINTSPVFGSHRVTFKNDKQKAYYSKNVYAEIFKRYNLDKIIPKGYVFYGEIYGSNIQNNYEYGLSNGEIDVVFFDIKHNNEYLPWDEFTKIINSLNLKHVPVIFKGKRKDIDFEKACVGKSILDPNTKVREGCVVKSIIETRDNTLGRRILKVINKKYLENKNNTEYH
jgi:RNA ligase (TIGR02306 family)